jgi:hypothetical protein
MDREDLNPIHQGYRQAPYNGTESIPHTEANNEGIIPKHL